MGANVDEFVTTDSIIEQLCERSRGRENKTGGLTPFHGTEVSYYHDAGWTRQTVWQKGRAVKRSSSTGSLGTGGPLAATLGGG